MRVAVSASTSDCQPTRMISSRVAKPARKKRSGSTGPLYLKRRRSPACRPDSLYSTDGCEMGSVSAEAQVHIKLSTRAGKGMEVLPASGPAAVVVSTSISECMTVAGASIQRVSPVNFGTLLVSFLHPKAAGEGASVHSLWELYRVSVRRFSFCGKAIFLPLAIRWS